MNVIVAFLEGRNNYIINCEKPAIFDGYPQLKDYLLRLFKFCCIMYPKIKLFNYEKNNIKT